MENKTFGATLAELRKSNGLTQLDLADRLGVTDKAVSKWERNLALPEVETLIKISDLFGVSLDVLLRGEEFAAAVETVEKSEPKYESESEPTPKHEHAFPARKIVGTILLCFGALTALLLTLLGDLLSGLIFASPFLLCGAICMIFKRRLGLWCTWAVYFSVFIFMHLRTSLHMIGLLQNTYLWLTSEIDGMWFRVLVGWILALIWGSLVVWTAFSYKNELFPRKKMIICIATSVLLYLAIRFGSAGVSYLISIFTAPGNYALSNFVMVFFSWVRLLCIAACIIAFVNLIVNRKKLEKRSA